MIELTMYSKKDCHLCDIAKETLRKMQHEFPISLTEIDIEKNSELFEEYKYLIPVIEIDGERMFIYRVDEAGLKKILREKSRPR